MSATIDSTLTHINRQSEEQIAQEIAQEYNMPYALLDDYPFRLETLSLLPLDQAAAQNMAPYVRAGSKIRVAVTHPEATDFATHMTTLANQWQATLEPTVVSGTSFHYLLTRYNELKKEAVAEQQHAQEVAERKAEKDYFTRIKSLADLQQEIEHASTTEILDVIIAAGYNEGASDIHLEPGEQTLTVRFRIDGVLQKVLSLPIQTYHAIVSRIKMLAQIKLDLSTVSQDGRFTMQNRGIDADFRVSIIPTGYGPGVVMRILRQDVESLSLQQLGFSQHDLDLIAKAVHRPYGLVLVTGPTGSGKSTTLYALLQVINSAEKKVLTLEDPIEYRLPSIQQSQVDPDHGYTFAEGLRGLLRQDPDIVMVGEIRDPETATIALNASLTGHLVLSTLHTNDAVSAHARFLELGVAPFLLSGSIQLIIAQRLVRRLAPGSDPANPTYKGRIVIAEVLEPSAQFEQAVVQHQDPASLHTLAVQGGMIPMVEDGIRKVREGITTEEEVYRVTTI